MTRFNGDGRELQEFDKADIGGLNKWAARRFYSNRTYHNSLSDLVCTPDGMRPSNPEYVARAQSIKKLKEKLAIYTGSKEAASNIVFQLKQDSDRDHKDFTQTALLEVERMVGKKPLADYTITEITEMTLKRPKWSTWRYLWHRISGGIFYPEGAGDI